MKRLFVLVLAFVMLFSVSASAAKSAVDLSDVPLYHSSGSSTQINCRDFDGRLYRLWISSDGSTQLSSYFIDNPVYYDNYIVLHNDRSRFYYVSFVDDPSLSYRLVYDSDNRYASPSGIEFVSSPDLSDVVYSSSSNASVSSSASSSRAASMVSSLDSAIDELCEQYSISKQDLYFHLLKDILSSCE